MVTITELGPDDDEDELVEPDDIGEDELVDDHDDTNEDEFLNLFNFWEENKWRPFLIPAKRLRDIYCVALSCKVCDTSEACLSERASIVLILDIQVVLNLIDIIENVNDAVVLYTLLEVVKESNLAIHSRLQALCNSYLKNFYVFDNEHFMDTHIMPIIGETESDRNDRAVLVAAQWYQSHLVDHHPVLLLTNNCEDKRKALDEGILAETVDRYFLSVNHPDLLKLCVDPSRHYVRLNMKSDVWQKRYAGFSALAVMKPANKLQVARAISHCCTVDNSTTLLESIVDKLLTHLENENPKLKMAALEALMSLDRAIKTKILVLLLRRLNVADKNFINHYPELVHLILQPDEQCERTLILILILEMLLCVISEFGKDLYAWINEVANSLVPLLQSDLHSESRMIAGIRHLLRSAVPAVQNRKLEGNSLTSILRLGIHVMTALTDTLGEDDKENPARLFKAIDECVKFSSSILTCSHFRKIVEEILKDSIGAIEIGNYRELVPVGPLLPLILEKLKKSFCPHFDNATSRVAFMWGHGDRRVTAHYLVDTVARDYHREAYTFLARYHSWLRSAGDQQAAAHSIEVCRDQLKSITLSRGLEVECLRRIFVLSVDATFGGFLNIYCFDSYMKSSFPTFTVERNGESDTESALHLVSKTVYDIIFLQTRLGLQDSFELVRTLRGPDFQYAGPIIVHGMWSEDDNEAVKECLLAGADRLYKLLTVPALDDVAGLIWKLHM